MAVPYTFGTATASIPLSQLDSNFATTITLGNTAIQLGNTVTTLNNMTLANVTVSSGNVTFTNVSATTANVTTANITTAVIGTATITTTGITTANVTTANIATAVITTANVTTANVSTALSYSGTLTGGTGIVNLGSGQLYKDASGNVGISTTSPSGYLWAPAAADNAQARLGQLTLNSSQVGGYTGAIIWANWNLLTNTKNIAGHSYGIDLGRNGDYFAVVYIPAGSTTNTERMRIDSSGNVGIGTSSPNASAILDAQSTTKGVRMPNMTTTQKNAIASPAAGLMVFDTTLSKLCVYSGSAWQTITSV